MGARVRRARATTRLTICVRFAGGQKAGLRGNAGHPDGGQFASAPRFAAELARARGDVVSAAVEGADRVRTECGPGEQRDWPAQ